MLDSSPKNQTEKKNRNKDKNRQEWANDLRSLFLVKLTLLLLNIFLRKSRLAVEEQLGSQHHFDFLISDFDNRFHQIFKVLYFNSNCFHLLHNYVMLIKSLANSFLIFEIWWSLKLKICSFPENCIYVENGVIAFCYKLHLL